jgi:hypothetical protein
MLVYRVNTTPPLLTITEYNGAIILRCPSATTLNAAAITTLPGGGGTLSVWFTIGGVERNVTGMPIIATDQLVLPPVTTTEAAIAAAISAGFWPSLVTP